MGNNTSSEQIINNYNESNNNKHANPTTTSDTQSQPTIKDIVIPTHTNHDHNQRTNHNRQTSDDIVNNDSTSQQQLTDSIDNNITQQPQQQQQEEQANNNNTDTDNYNTDSSKPWWYTALHFIEFTNDLLLQPPTSITATEYYWLNSLTIDDIMIDAADILILNDKLAYIRYKLVPARISEFRFWQNVLLHLRHYYNIHNNANNIDNNLSVDTIDKNNTFNDNVNNHDNNYATKSPLQSDYVITNGVHNNINNDNHNVNDNNNLLQRINKLELQLQHVTKQYTELQKQYNILLEQQNDMTTTNKICIQCNNTLKDINYHNRLTECIYHSGQFELDKISKEFYALDNTLKQTLRTEKQKRISQVMNELKFILDTDDIQDAYGHYSCCNADKYNAKGCKTNTSHNIQLVDNG